MQKTSKNFFSLRHFNLLAPILISSIRVFPPKCVFFSPEYKKAFHQVYGFSFPAFSFARMSTSSANGGRMTTIIVQPQQQQQCSQPMTIRIHPQMAKESFSPIGRPE
jgi:hypothetical protein